MKKVISCFLMVCTFLTAQVSFTKKASATTDDFNTQSSVIVEDNKKFPVPMVVKAEQISTNQIQITYDRPVIKSLGEKATNYWIQDLKNPIQKGIATLGKNDKVNSNNSLTDKLVKINSKDGSLSTFILTFNQNIPRREQYKIIVCYVTVDGAPVYNGDNGSAIINTK